MATPTVNFAFADFTDDTTGVHRVQLSPGYFGLTDTNGEIAFANVTPGIYTINAPGVASLRITVPNAAGPYDAVDLVNPGQDFDAGGDPNGRLSCKKDDPYYDKPNGKFYVCLGGTSWQELVG